ncbi:hypothetical protein F8568_043075 [Actinomadura sp. LD22]|uniref:Amidase domain-containing protein n=1 Tax=Actinomadura physcomitrii TaxID=2650748 RepID=A0A6I4MMB9_9ACTN|nr:hypothetical protein [Actinomadura physcomitrii]
MLRTRRCARNPRHTLSPEDISGGEAAPMRTLAADLIDLARKMRSGEASPVELLQDTQLRIVRTNGGPPTTARAPDAINAWVRLYPDRALEAAAAADTRLARDPSATPLLCGIPIGLKDVLGVRVLPLTGSSAVLADHKAEEDTAQHGNGCAKRQWCWSGIRTPTSSRPEAPRTNAETPGIRHGRRAAPRRPWLRAWFLRHSGRTPPAHCASPRPCAA